MTTNAPAEISSVYLDSCVLIAAVCCPDVTVRDELRELFNQMDNGRLIAYTSTFTLSEVRTFKIDATPVPEDDPDAVAIRGLLNSRRIIKRPLIEYLGARAQQIGMDNPLLMPGDCVHIATAEQMKVDVLFTYDGGYKVGRRKPDRMLAYDGQHPVRLAHSTGVQPARAAL